MKMKKKLIALSVLAASVVSASSMAAVSTGQLTFNWQGVVPSTPVTGTDWAFVDGMDNLFIPATEQLRVNLDDAGDMTAVAVKPYDFFIIPTDSTATSGHVERSAKTLNANGIKAYLGSIPVSNGLNGNMQLALATGVTAGNNEVAVTLNGNALTLSSLDAIKVEQKADNKEAHVSIQLNAKVKAANVTEGASVSFTAPVIFSVDIA